MRRAGLALLLVAACSAPEADPVREPAAAPLPAQAPSAVPSTEAPPTSAPPVPPPSAPADVAPPPAECSGPLTFEHAPVDLDAIEYVLPLGLMSGSHVTPVDHQYFQNFKEPDRVIDVFSPAAGTVTSIQHMNRVISDGPDDPIDDYRLVIEHTCTISSIFIHIGTLSAALAAVAPPRGEHTSVAVEVAAGERIGTFRRNVDYNVVDRDVTRPFIVPEHYAAEPWKVHTPDPFDYFTAAIREELIAKSLRMAQPIGGEFVFDVDGRLVGNWFQQGTNGYGGSDRDRYWAGHLAVAYNFLDPSHIIVSIGTFDGKSLQAGVRGNGPDPATVTVATGPVLYELVRYDYYTGDQRWDRMSLVPQIEARNDEDGYGVVLFEMLSDRLLQVEMFPGASAADVTGFTAAALRYER